MPELPEVQTVCDVIGPQIVGCRIEKISINHCGVLVNADKQAFCNQLCDSTFLSMKRRGKYMLLSMDSGAQLVIHLRMTGCLLVTDADTPFEKHTHAVFYLRGGKQLRFIDQRRFGRFWILKQEETLKEIDKLGIEPSDERLTKMYLQAEIGKSRKTVKECLLDQTLIAGIGNIYSDEILHRARIHPEKKACDLSDNEFAVLAREIPDVMDYYTKTNAISPERYLQTGGRDYQNTPYLRVYGRAGNTCLRCGNTLQKITVGGRGSVFCPVCQQLDEND